MSDVENYLKTVIDYLKETFLKYLQPKIIIDQFISRGEFQETFLITDEENREELVETFLDWIVEHERSIELVKLFTVYLKKWPEKSMVNANIKDGNGAEVTVFNYLPDLIRIIDGTLIKALDTEDLAYILEKMIQYKLIIQQHAKLCHKAETPFEFCIEMFRSVKGRKPDWPFQFIDIIRTKKPEVLAMHSQETSLFGPPTKVMKLSSNAESSITDNHLTNLNFEKINKYHFTELKNVTASPGTLTEGDTLTSNNTTEANVFSQATGVVIPTVSLDTTTDRDTLISNNTTEANVISQTTSVVIPTVSLDTTTDRDTLISNNTTEANVMSQDTGVVIPTVSLGTTTKRDTLISNNTTEANVMSQDTGVVIPTVSLGTTTERDTLISNSTTEANVISQATGVVIPTVSLGTTTERDTLISNNTTEAKVINNTDIGIPMLNLEGEAYKPKPNSSRASVASSHFSDLPSCTETENDFKGESISGLKKITEEQKYQLEPFFSGASVASSGYSALSPDYSLTISKLSAKRIVTEVESSQPDFKYLLNKNVIDENLMTVVKDLDALSQSVGNSDSEDDSDDHDKEISEGPALNLRKYQIELAEKAVQGFNTVICAPTGSGKTRVASHIILEHLKQNRNRNKKTIAFLARTIPLTVQQYKVLNKSLPGHYKITYITGQSQDSLDLKTFVKRNNVVVLTPMILVNHLRKKTVHMRNFSLLIFDECHHCRKEEPYNLLMYMYLKAKLKGNERTKSNLPQIVGLSASIGIDKARNTKEASENILKICGNLDAPYLSTVQTNKDELNSLVPVPQEFDYQLKERDANDALNKVMEIMSKLEKHVANASKELDDPDIKDLVKNIPRNKKSQDYGKWTVDLKSAARSVPIDDQSRETKEPVRTLMILAEYLWSYNAALETHDLVELTDVMGYLKKRFDKFKDKARRTDKEDTFFTYFTDLIDLVKRRDEENNQNLQLLAKILMQNIVQKGEDSRGIIFVRTRALADALSSWLNRSRNKALLKASVFTGTNAKAEEGGMSQAEQEDAIREFRSGEIKVLVATSVAEEGLDIPDCNLVIKYNHVGNEITTVQTKGRSRKRGGVAYLLGMDNILKREYVNREKERLMKKAFVKINEMELAEREDFIKKYQIEIIQNAEIEEALAAKRKQKFKDIDFTMVCSLCRKVSINRKNIRVIFDKFRVSIDRELLQETCLKCIPMNSKYIDEMELIGPVFCQGQPKPGTFCGHKLGTMIKYGGVHYFAIGVKNFGFYQNSQEKLVHFKMWKSVPYIVEDLVTDDIKRYSDIPTEGNDNAGVSDDDDESSDDGDEDTSKTKCRPSEARNCTEDEPRMVGADKTTEDTLGDENNSVTHEDIQPTQVSNVTGSLAKRVESELGKAPSLTSHMEDEIKSHYLPSISSVAFSVSESEGSL